MSQTLTRRELVALVEKLCNSEGSEQELDSMLDLLKQNVPHPRVSDLIYWPQEELSAQEIVERALNYRPTKLS